MQELLTLPLGRNVLKFEVIEGVIAGEKKWSETHVYSTGGSGYVGSRGGYINLPAIHSNIICRHEVWVREHGSGKEFSLDFSGRDIALREGHEVAFVLADTGENQYFALLVNRTALQTFCLINNIRKFVIEATKMQKIEGAGLILGSLVGAVVCGIFVDKWVGGILGLVGIMWGVIKLSNWFQELHEAEAKTQVHFDQLASILIKQRNAPLMS